MATNHLLTAYQGGEFKFVAFGRWDGTPNIFGSKLLQELPSATIELIRSKLTLIDNSNILAGVETASFCNDLAPDMASDKDSSKILEIVKNLQEPTVIAGCLDLAISGATEWVYVLNYDTNQLEVYSQYALKNSDNIFDFLLTTNPKGEKINLMKAFCYTELPTVMNSIVNPYDPLG